MKSFLAFFILIAAPAFPCVQLTGLYDCPVGSGIASEEFKQTVSPTGVVTYEETLRLEQLAEPIQWKYPGDGKDFQYKHLSGEVSTAKATCVGAALLVRIKSKFTGVGDGGIRFSVIGSELIVMSGTFENAQFEPIHQVTCRKK